MTLPITDKTAKDYLAEWLQDASDGGGEDKISDSTIMYQIAEGVYSEVFPTGSLKVFAQSYAAWDDSIHPRHNNPLYVAFGGYRCGCTDLEVDMASIAPCCPHHDKPLYSSPQWVENTNNVPLGFEVYTEEKERQMLIDLIVASAEGESKRESRDREKEPGIDSSDPLLDNLDLFV